MRPSAFAMIVLAAALSIGPIAPARSQQPATAQPTAGQPGTQQPQEIEVTVKMQLSYLLFLPEGYDKQQDKAWPMILFLHGAGERGDDPQKVKERLQAMQLIHPMGMGRIFKVLMLSKGCQPPPALSGMQDPFK